MHKNDVSIVTITWARDEKEEILLRSSLKQLALLDVPVYITDGGSSASFLDYLRSFPQFILLPETASGVWPQVKNSLTAAYQRGAQYIFYTEPDKLDFCSKGLPMMLDELKTDESTGVVTASRSVTGFATFPRFQQMTETAINNCVAEIVGQEMDYTYGPFLMNKNLVPYLIQMRENTSWGWRPYAFVMAKRLGYKVESFEADFSCPVEQQPDDPLERIYRMRQLSQNIQGLVLAANAVLQPAGVASKE